MKVKWVVPIWVRKLWVHTSITYYQKNKYPELAYDKCNIILLTLDEHTNVEADMYRYEEVNRRRIELLNKINQWQTNSLTLLKRETESIQTLFNVNKIIFTVEKDNGDILVVLDDIHERVFETDIINPKTGKKTGGVTRKRETSSDRDHSSGRWCYKILKT